MSWRLINRTDLLLGTVVRQNDMSFSNMVIIAILPNHVRLARPYAYARDVCNLNNPLIGCETFEVTIESILNPTSKYEVYAYKTSNVAERYIT